MNPKLWTIIKKLEKKTQSSDVKRAQICAGLVNKTENHLISWATNCVIKGDCWTLHAEERLLKNLRRCPSGAVLVVVRSLFRDSKPCAKCMRAISRSQVSRLIFKKNGRWIYETL